MTKAKTKILLALICFILVTVAITSSIIFSNFNRINFKTKTITVENQPKNPTPENINVLGVEDIKKQSEAKTETQINFDKQILYGLINSYRKDHDLNELFVNKALETSAQSKLNDMIEKEYFRHADTNNNESWYLFSEAGYRYKFAGENLSTGINTPWQVFSAWQKSDKHNEQLLKQEYLEMGLAVDCSTYKIGKNNSCLVVLHLGAR